MIDREQIANGWTARGFSCDLWTDPPGQRWEDFTHATDEVVVVLEGEMEFQVEGQVYRPQPGAVQMTNDEERKWYAMQAISAGWSGHGSDLGHIHVHGSGINRPRRFCHGIFHYQQRPR
jgi:hypothetical protein